MNRTWIAGLALVGGTLAGCGDGGGSCGAFMACGGDVTGTWQIQTLCMGELLVAPDEEFCPGARTDASKLTVTGTTTFNADKTYSANVTIGGSMSMTLPESCLTVQGVKITCAQLEATLSGNIATDPDAPFSKATCTGTTSCKCTFTYKPMPQQESGTYVTAGNVLTMTQAGSSGEAQDYCVRGDELTVAEPIEMNMGMMGTTSMRAYYRAKKR